MTAVLSVPVQDERPDTDDLTWFRFGDINPMTGAPYVASRFAELPAYAANVVRGTRLSPEQWDALVAAGGASAVPGIGGWHALAGWRAEVNSRDYDNPPADVCGDCFGTCVTADIDGSITGTVGEPFLCFCAQGALAQVGR